jgi:hypothetical protein
MPANIAAWDASAFASLDRTSRQQIGQCPSGSGLPKTPRGNLIGNPETGQ